MNAQNRHIDRLIARHLDGERLSDAEQAELLDWLRSSEEHRRSYLDAYDAWGERHLPDTLFDAEAAYRRLTERIAEPEECPAAPAVRRRFVGIACAAACTVLLVTGFFPPRQDRTANPPTFGSSSRRQRPPYTPKRRCSSFSRSRKRCGSRRRNPRSATMPPRSTSTKMPESRSRKGGGRVQPAARTLRQADDLNAGRRHPRVGECRIAADLPLGIRR